MKITRLMVMMSLLAACFAGWTSHFARGEDPTTAPSDQKPRSHQPHVNGQIVSIDASHIEVKNEKWK